MRQPAAPPGATMVDYPVTKLWNELIPDLALILAYSKDKKLLAVARKLVNVDQDCAHGQPYQSLSGEPCRPHVDDYYFFVLLVAEFKNRYDRIGPGEFKPRTQAAVFEI